MLISLVVVWCSASGARSPRKRTSKSMVFFVSTHARTHPARPHECTQSEDTSAGSHLRLLHPDLNLRMINFLASGQGDLYVETAVCVQDYTGAGRYVIPCFLLCNL